MNRESVLFEPQILGGKNMKTIRNNLIQTIMVILLSTVFAGSVIAGEQHVDPVAEEIPDNANKIILNQDEQAAGDMYVDALNFLESHGYTVIHSEEPVDVNTLNDLVDQHPLIMRAEKKVSDDLTMQIAINVNTTPGGSELAASVYYADSKDVTQGNWHQATWTEGDAKKAFNMAFHDLRAGTYDTMQFESGVAVTRK